MRTGSEILKYELKTEENGNIDGINVIVIAASIPGLLCRALINEAK